MKQVRFVYEGRVCRGILKDGQVHMASGLCAAESDIRTWLPPVEPIHMYAVALNYTGIFEDLELEKPVTEPVAFQKFNTTACGHLANVVCPEGVEELQCEAELLLVIGKEGRNIKKENAMEYVAGYTIGNDVTIPNMIVGKHSRPPLKAKQHDSFGPMGQCYVEKNEIADPSNLQIRVSVNGELRQSGSTADMVFSIAEILAYLSAYMTLQPGDIIWTGTPRGSVMVRPGDIMTLEIDGIGKLENYVVRR